MPPSGGKPVLPILNLTKVKSSEGEQSQADALTPRRHLLGATARQTVRHSLLTGATGGNAQLQAASQADGALSSRHSYTVTTSGASVGSNSGSTAGKSTKTRVPALNFSKHEGLGFGSGGGVDSSVSARASVATSSAVDTRGAATSRPAYGTAHSGADVVSASDASAARATSTTPAAAVTAAAAAATSAWESGSITPAQALKRYSEYLTNYEQAEILDFPQVYFVGRSGAPKIKGNPHLTKSNFGYDEERGDYNCVMHDHLAYRYEVLSLLGKGSFGQVLKCHDFKTNTLRAIKIIRNKKRFHHQALVELKVLQEVRNRDTDDSNHVIHIHEHFYFRSHLCITFELLSVNLYEFIKQNNFMGLSLSLIRRFGHQILVSLKYMKSLQIIHCDLKPENILLRQPNRSVIKVIDFGSSCFQDERVYTYIQSRFYRSPEVILGLPYGPPIDMWSFGCIIAELYTGYPLFPGEDEHEQLQCIMELFGPPPAHLLDQASRVKLFFDTNMQPRIVANSQGKLHTPGTKMLQTVLKCSDQGFLDLLEKCLRWDPAERIQPEQALQHVWIMDQNPSPTARTTNAGGKAVEASAAGTARIVAKEKEVSVAAVVLAEGAGAAAVARIEVVDTAMGHAAGAAAGTTWGATQQQAAEEAPMMPTPRGQPPGAPQAMLQAIGSMKRGAVAAPPLALAQLRASLVMEPGSGGIVAGSASGGALQPSFNSPRGRPASGTQGIKPLTLATGQPREASISGASGLVVGGWDAGTTITSPPADGGAAAQRHVGDGAPHLAALKPSKSGVGSSSSGREGLSSPRTSTSSTAQFLPQLGRPVNGKQ